MPDYVYRCPQCEIRHEVSHGMKEEPSIFCVACQEPMARVPQVALFTACVNGDIEGNRWHGSQRDKLEQQRTYSDENRAKKDDKARDDSLVEAQMTGREMLTSKTVKPQMGSFVEAAVQAAREKGVRVRA